MTTLPQSTQRAGIARVKRMLAVAVPLLLLVGVVFADSAETLLGFFLITIAVVAPCALWLGLGAPGIPILPVVAIVYLIYYALPILRGNFTFRGNLGGDTLSWDIVHAAASVSLFLATATVCWFAVLKSVHRSWGSTWSTLATGRYLNRVIFCGLALGIAYNLAALSSALDLGSLLGLIRSIALATASVACFLLGYARAQGSLRGGEWKLAIFCLCALTILTWSSLFLVQGIMMNLAALLGFVITAKRIPWRVVLLALPVVAVLHAGKSEMREKYWAARSNSLAGMSLMAVPGEMTEWAIAGVRAIASGDAGDSVIDRASLLQLLLRVQRLAPDVVPYLEGETFALLPSMLVPRFVQEDKIASQAAMTLLNVRFGFQTAEAASITAIGFGLIADGYANFGDFGVVGVAIFIGLLSGFLTRWSAGQSAVSLPSLIAVAGMMTLVNAEQDFSYLMVNFSQAAGTLAIVHTVLQFLFGPRRARARAIRPIAQS